MRPVRLGPNQPPRFYRGGEAISRLRGLPSESDFQPEDWVGSATTLFGEREAGLTRLPDGRWLAEALAEDPEGYLGPEHAAAWGGDPALLVKLLDAGERLPVHCHPDREFARRHLDCPYGKTEAWVVVETRGAQPLVHLGFRHDVDGQTLRDWVQTQDTTAMLAATNAVTVAPGDAVLVPAGLPHAIGEGVFVVELQEPTDFSVLLEWDGFDVDGPRDGHLALGFDVALECVDRSVWDAGRLARLQAGRTADPAPTAGVEVLLPPEADAFFRAERITPPGPVPVAAGFCVLVVVAGQGRLTTERGGDVDLARGDTVLVPYGAGDAELSGGLELVRCRPPARDAGLEASP